MSKQTTAAFLIIGNEILSGRTQDTNLNHIAKVLAELGIKLRESRVVCDVEAEIIKAVNELRSENDYVFTSGGIGPTHDDITSDSVAKAFGVKLELNKEALGRLQKHYTNPADLNDARKKMAYIPVGASLIDNPVSAAPGFRLGNVHVMAGVPSIFKAMVDFVRPTLKGGGKILSVSVTTNLTEGTIAEKLGKIQAENAAVDIGSYPHIKDGKLGVSLVTRGTDKAAIDVTVRQIGEMIKETGGQFSID